MGHQVVPTADIQDHYRIPDANHTAIEPIYLETRAFIFLLKFVTFNFELF